MPLDTVEMSRVGRRRPAAAAETTRHMVGDQFDPQTRIPAAMAGECVEAAGKWVVDKNHGPQFKAESAQVTHRPPAPGRTGRSE